MTTWQNEGLPTKPMVCLPSLPTPNPILFELGCQKNRPVLAHEIGAGSPCLRCKELCPGLDLHYWRKICKICKCPKDDHKIPPAQSDPGKLRIGKLFDRPMRTAEDEAAFTITKDAANSKNADNLVTASKNQLPNVKFDWIPPNTTAKLVEKFMEKLPLEARPIVDSDGAMLRRVALERQLPMHDYDSKACHDLTADETNCMQKFVDYFKRDVIGQGVVLEPDLGDSESNDDNLSGPIIPKPSPVISNISGTIPKTKEVHNWKCEKCGNQLHKGEVAVFAERAGPKVCWHPGCFCCSECNELLADLIYFYKDNKIYCGRHFGNKLFPRCAGCDELIFAKEFTDAEDKSWHLKHFCCYNCDVQLGGQRYMCKEGQPYCLNCYKEIFARTCEFCRQKIAADVNRITHENYNWHATSECFFCCCCKISLLKQRFLLKGGKIFCSVECKKKMEA